MNNINISNPFVILFVAGTLLSFFVNQILDFINFLSRKKTSGVFPKELENIPSAAVFDREKLKKISDYENVKYFFSIPQALVSVALTLFLALSGFYPWLLNKCLFNGIPSGFIQTFISAFLFFFLASIPELIISVPFSLYSEFKIEKQFGFSKMTLKLWLLDQVKGFIVSMIFTAILLFAMIGVMSAFPKFWWIFLAAVMFLFSLVMQVLYPLVIAPVFNKFSPLEDGELKTRLENLLAKTGFKSSGVFLMNASKRSGHSNAYFGGMGKSKRIVLFDTLVSQLTPQEIEAVLGHELGHYKLKHIVKRFVLSVPFVVLLMYLLFFCSTHISIYTGFGFGFCEGAIVPPSLQFVGLFLSSMVWSELSFLITPVTNFMSRKDEYQADNFSKEITKNPDALVSGLIKLNSENLSELIPSKIYAFWNYSHPTLLERIKNLTLKS